MIYLVIIQASRKDLLMQDFEGTLKYFRVQLPKKYRAEESSKELMQQAVSLKVSILFLSLSLTLFFSPFICLSMNTACMA